MFFTREEVGKIEKIPISTNTQDSLICHYDMSGLFSVKSCYHLLKEKLELDRRGDNKIQMGYCEADLWKHVWSL